MELLHQLELFCLLADAQPYLASAVRHLLPLQQPAYQNQHAQANLQIPQYSLVEPRPKLREPYYFAMLQKANLFRGQALLAARLSL
ncbi:Uncharacterised protein [Chlamydia trachomatis]|nr:Uncharacterised protein [Chlamydia trachomatis]